MWLARFRSTPLPLPKMARISQATRAKTLHTLTCRGINVFMLCSMEVADLGLWSKKHFLGATCHAKAEQQLQIDVA